MTLPLASGLIGLRACFRPALAELGRGTLGSVVQGKGPGLKPIFLSAYFPGLKPGASTGRCFASIWLGVFRRAYFGRNDNILLRASLNPALAEPGRGTRFTSTPLMPDGLGGRPPYCISDPVCCRAGRRFAPIRSHTFSSKSARRKYGAPWFIPPPGLSGGFGFVAVG
jgi:hypothetical protein